jgi:toxin FitB
LPAVRRGRGASLRAYRVCPDAGRPADQRGDAQIAAIALASRMALATRNTTDFERIDGLEVVNPWTDGA